MVNRQPRLQFAANEQPGYTLTELLIVIMIALLLMVVSLPTLKSVMEDARPREASRVLNTMIFTAKARAAQSGNPAGIEFVCQRMNDPMASQAAYQCTQMYMCEVPPIYAGDTVDARVTVNTSTGALTFLNGAADNLPSLLDATNLFWIRINHRGPWYRGTRTSGSYTIQPNGVLPPTTDPNGYSFQIRRQPVRVGNPVELPKSTAIDMTYSGFGLNGTEFDNALALRVLFSPAGNIESYTRSYAATMPGGMSTYDPEPQAAIGTMHFLVGVTNKVNVKVDSSAGPLANIFDAERSNLADANALWVSVGRATGIVTTNENNAVPATGLSPGSTSDQDTYLENCRQYATNREQKGGR